jgi:hypothetical protein
MCGTDLIAWLVGCRISGAESCAPNSSAISYVDKSEDQASRLVEIDPASHTRLVYFLDSRVVLEEVKNTTMLPLSGLLMPKMISSGVAAVRAEASSSVPFNKNEDNSVEAGDVL